MRLKTAAFGLVLPFLVADASAACPPAPPGNFDYEISESGGLTLMWIPPEFTGTSAIDGYVLYWTEAGVEMDPIPLDKSITEYEFGELEAETEYTFSVTAKNEEGVESLRITLVLVTRFHWPKCQPILLSLLPRDVDVRPECFALL